MKIRITKQADEEFTYDGEDEASIRQALLHAADGTGVPGIVYDITDMDRSDMDADEYLAATEDDGTPLWSGWLGGVTAPPPVDRAALEQLAATWDGLHAALDARSREAETLDDKPHWARLRGRVAQLAYCAGQLRKVLGGGTPDVAEDAVTSEPATPVVIVFDINEGIQQWFDELATAVREQSGGTVIITEVDAQMSDVMLAVADRPVGADEAIAIWHSDGDDD